VRFAPIRGMNLNFLKISQEAKKFERSVQVSIAYAFNFGEEVIKA
jgi:hypothetical protein